MSSKNIDPLTINSDLASLLIESERGCSKSQQLLGRQFCDLGSDPASNMQAYKWFFISSALGNKAAEPDFQMIHTSMDVDDAGEAYQLAESWFDEKFDLVEEMPDAAWSLELLKWRFASSNVH